MDPNALAADGTISIGEYDISDDGTKIAYSISRKGSDWREVYVRDVASKADLTDKLEWVKFSSIDFDPKGEGFYYSRYPAPENGNDDAALKFQKVYYHRIGTPQADDQLIFEDPQHQEYFFTAFQTDDGKYLVVSITKGTDDDNLLFVKDLSLPDSQFKAVITEFEGSLSYIDNEGPNFSFLTTRKSPKGRVVRFDINQAAEANWQTLIAESALLLECVSPIGDKLLVTSMRDAASAVAIHDYEGKFESWVTLPGVGSAGGFGGKNKSRSDFFRFLHLLDQQQYTNLIYKP